MIHVPQQYGYKTLDKSFRDEVASTERFLELMEPYFVLVPEVQMQHYDGSKMRIDFLGRPRHREDMPWLPWAGFELKARFKEIKDFCKALKQGIDYRHGVVVDKRLQNIRGMTPPFLFIWPDPSEEDYGFVKGIHGGAVRVAGQYNVGVLRHESYAFYSRFGTRISLAVSGTLLWDSVVGSRGNSKTFGTARRRGSA